MVVDTVKTKFQKNTGNDVCCVCISTAARYNRLFTIHRTDARLVYLVDQVYFSVNWHKIDTTRGINYA